MNQESIELTGGWSWGALWVLYAYFYGLYFGRVSNRLKPDLDSVKIPGSPERLRFKQIWCFRFGGFMLLPTFLESVRSSWFTSTMISVLPCFFGLWVIHAVWREVLHSKLPQSRRPNRQRR